MKWVQYPFMKAMATEAIVMATEKMGIMESGDGVHTVCVTAMATEEIEFFGPFRCRHSVNEP